MRPRLPGSSTFLRAVSAGVVALGVAGNDGFALSPRSVPALVLIAVGLVGVTSAVGDRPAAALRRVATRWWALALVTFLPYGLATAPSSERAAAVGDAVVVPVAALEAVAGAAFLSAVSVTVLYWFAAYGVHPGRPTPEERVLDDYSDN